MISRLVTLFLVATVPFIVDAQIEGSAPPLPVCNPSTCSCRSECWSVADDDEIGQNQQIVCGKAAVQAVLQHLALTKDDIDPDLGVVPIASYPGDVLVVKTTRPGLVSRWDALSAKASALRGRAEPNHTYSLQSPPIPNDKQIQEQWPLVGWNTDKSCFDQANPYCVPDCSPNAAIGAGDAWEEIEGNPPATPVVIGIIDQIPESLDDLDGNLWKNPKEVDNGVDDWDHNSIIDDIYGFNAASNKGIDHDELGWSLRGKDPHGTAVAGIIAAIGHNDHRLSGILWKAQAQLVLCKATDTAGELAGCLGYFNSLREDGVPIVAVNVSLGGNGCSCCVEEQLRALRERGVLVVAAAGNEGCGNGPRDPTPTKCFIGGKGPCLNCPMYPASNAVSNVISVGAASCSSAPFKCSNYGSRSTHLFAPGVKIRSLGQDWFECTSAAAPHVTGALGLLKSTPTGAPLDWRTLRNLTLAGGAPFATLLKPEYSEPLARGLATITGRYLKVSGPGQPSGNRYGMLHCAGQSVRRRVWPTEDHVTFKLHAQSKPMKLVAIDIVCATSQPPVPLTVQRKVGGNWISQPGEQSLVDTGQSGDECPGDGEHSWLWIPPSIGKYRLRFWNPQADPDGEDLIVDVTS